MSLDILCQKLASDIIKVDFLSLPAQEWQKYFDKPSEERAELLNVISLEISNTKLDSQIQVILSYAQSKFYHTSLLPKNHVITSRLCF